VLTSGYWLKLLDKGKSIYNLGLLNAKKRLNRLRADKEYQTILSLRRDLKKGQAADQAGSTNSLRDIVTKRYFLTKTGIEKYVKDNAGISAGWVQLSVRADISRSCFRQPSRRFCTGNRRRFVSEGKWDNILASVNSKSSDTGILL